MHIAFDLNHEAFLDESVEVSSHEAFRHTNGLGNAPGLSARVGRDMREHHQVLAMPALH